MQTARSSIRKNIAYGFSSWIVPIVLGILITPVIVRSLGAHEYGIYALVLGFVAYSFNFNIGRAVTKYVSEYRATGETEKIRDVITATLAVNVAVGVLSLGLTLLLAEWVVADLFQIDESKRVETVTALNISAFIIFLLMLGQVFHAVIQGVNRLDVFSKIQNATSFLLMAGNLVIVLAGYGLKELLFWNLFTVVLNCLFGAISARRLLPEFGLSKRLNGAVAKQVIRYSSAVVGYQITANIILLFERGWITAKLGSENLTYYVIPMTLGILLHGFIFSLTMTLFPLASELADRREELLKLYKKASKAVWFLVAFAVATLIALNHTLLTVWVGPEFGSQSADILTLHALTFGILAVAIIAFQLSEGLAFPGFGFLTTLCVLIVSLPLIVMLAEPYGNLGVAVARLAGFMFLLPAIAFLEHWAFGRFQISFWSSVLGPLLISAVVAAGTQKIMEMILPGGWPSLLATVATGGAAYCLSLFALGFVGEEEKEMFEQVRRKILA